MNFEFNIIVKASRLRQTANLNLRHVRNQVSPLYYLLFTVHRSLYTTGKFYPQECFYAVFICSIHILKIYQLESQVCCLSYRRCLLFVAPLKTTQRPMKTQKRAQMVWTGLPVLIFQLCHWSCQFLRTARGFVTVI